MDVLIVFGSKSDEKTYSIIAEGLKKAGISFKLRICSAHKTPDALNEILNSDAKIIIAGAGLAAHLPGVIASKTIRPVIGVPCDINFGGLDAFLSIVQMPPGVPVLTVGVNKPRIAVKECIKILRKFSSIHLIGDKNNKVLKKAEDVITDFGIAYSVSKTADAEKININFTKLGSKIKETSALVIYCPVSDEQKPQDAIKMMQSAEQALWVGLNNASNAAISAVELLNLDGKYANLLNENRKKSADKIKKDNEDLR